MFILERMPVKRLVVVVSTLLFALVAVILGCTWYIDMYADEYLYDSVEAVPVNKVGLLLGTSKKLADGRKNMYFHNRMQAAAELYHAGRIRYIIVSGDNGSIYYNEPRDMRRALLQLNIPDSAIVLDHAGFSTFDSIIRSKKIFGQRSITVISQRFHNERAVFIARERGVEAVGYNADDVDAYNGFGTRVRELFARVKVFLDLYILDQQPRYLGNEITIPPADSTQNQ